MIRALAVAQAGRREVRRPAAERGEAPIVAERRLTALGRRRRGILEPGGVDADELDGAAERPREDVLVVVLVPADEVVSASELNKTTDPSELITAPVLSPEPDGPLTSTVVPS